ncbi:bacteriohemerythrin [Lachnospiraceae bacterium LCP25S3_G4]
MRIEFDESLVTGNELIDTQHQELIARVNKLTTDCSVGKEKNVAVQTLGYLMDYTEFHFHAEEELQEENGYPQLVAHQGQHAEFKKAVDELKEMFEEEEGPTEAFVLAVKKNVVDWLLNHIKIWDKEVAEFVKNK